MCSILVCSQSFLEIEFFFSSLLYHIKKKKRYRIEIFVKIFVIIIATPSVSIIVSIKNNKK